MTSRAYSTDVYLVAYIYGHTCRIHEKDDDVGPYISNDRL